MENEKVMVHKGTKIGVSFLIGTAVVIAAGVFLASDKERRRKLVEWLKARRDEGRGQYLSKKYQVNAAIEAGRKAYNETQKELMGV